ncbi:protein big brother [Culicoides brevitarsis]|uniref:protein big brother n=1 Tax=Culicoides brevitarsis TaxID=469753 RepID=UPI00307B8C8B
MYNDMGINMVPFDMNGLNTMGLYEAPRPRFIFKMPRVVPEQKQKFETDDLFRKLSRDSEIRYTGFRDRPPEERRARFQNGCREGHLEIAFAATGINLQLMFNPGMSLYMHERECDFDKEHGKVHIKSHFIMNGVCIKFRGWLDLERLDGIGCLELDEKRAAHEDAILKEQLDRYNRRLRDFEDTQRTYGRADEYDARRSGGATIGTGNMWRR